LHEGEELMPLLANLYQKENINTFQLIIAPEVSILRNSHRRICKLLRHPILWTEETKKLAHCPMDGSELLDRGVLDKPEIIKKRVKEYEKRTLPMVQWLNENGFSVKRVNGEITVGELFNNILSELGYF
jgi:adenylate kinase family enzyme